MAMIAKEWNRMQAVFAFSAAASKLPCLGRGEYGGYGTGVNTDWILVVEDKQTILAIWQSRRQ